MGGWGLRTLNMCWCLRTHAGGVGSRQWGLENGRWGLRTCVGARERVPGLENGSAGRSGMGSAGVLEREHVETRGGWQFENE